MSIRISRALLLGSSALMSFHCVADDARAQTTTLPEVTVSAPSPIVRRPAPRPAAAAPTTARRTATAPTTARRTAPTPTPPTPVVTEPAQLQGTLPIVTDQFATVTVVTAPEIQRSTAQNLGDVMFSKPGITSTTTAPGASRPVIRGQDNFRVRIQENGIATGDVSDTGEDHAVTADPLVAGQIEVIRGPATLRWGSQAIGGVVNVDNNRIPTWATPRGINLQTKGGALSVDNGLEGAFLLDARDDKFAFHADAFGRRADDYRIPSYPYLFPPDPAPTVNGRQPNTSLHTSGQSVGGSYLFDGGFVGVAVSHFASLYRIPGIEATETGTRIDADQVKITSKGEFRPQATAIDTIRFWLGASDYKHNELAFENGFDGIQQTFTNKSQEGRVEVQLMPANLGFAALTTAVGVQSSATKLTAPGVEGGLFDPNWTTTAAAYIFNEFKFANAPLRMQIAGRIEQSNVKGSVPDLLVDPTLVIERDLRFTPKSGAVGFLVDLPWDMVWSVTGQYVERAPRAPELLSRGVHEATGTFDIGNPEPADRDRPEAPKSASAAALGHSGSRPPPTTPSSRTSSSGG